MMFKVSTKKLSNKMSHFTKNIKKQLQYIVIAKQILTKTDRSSTLINE